MAWKIDICDDEEAICALLCNYLDRMQADCGERFQIRIFHSAEELLGAARPDTDAVLLDISMGAMTGMDAAKELRARGSRVALVFITTMTQYAIEGYEVHAFGFLRKPLEYRVFRRQMEDLIAHLRRAQGSAWEVRTGADSRILATNEIVCLDAYGHSVTVRLADGSTLPCSATLSEAEGQLERVGFFRCHKSYLVNLKHVKQIGTDSVTVTGDLVIPLSRHRRKDFLAAFARHREGLL